MTLTKSQELSKRVTQFAVHKLGGGRSAEQFTGIDDTRLSRYQNENEDSHIRLFEFLDLDAATRHEALKYLAQQCGVEVITPSEKRELRESVTKLLGRVSQQLGKFVGTAANAAADEICTVSERRDVDADRSEAHGVVDQLADAVIQMPRSKAV
jgi:hypothetical protein